jgi:fructoselysine-6-P-deglycase FrlB-like protein
VDVIAFPEGMRAQPEVIARSATAVQTAIREVGPVASGQLVAIIGIGASEHICRSVAPAWRHGGLRAVALSAAELLPGGAGIAEVYVGLSESGRSAETVGVFAALTERRVGVTNGPGSPLTAVVDDLVLLDSGSDSPVYTTGYTATIQALGMLGEHWQVTRSRRAERGAHRRIQVPPRRTCRTPSPRSSTTRSARAPAWIEPTSSASPSTRAGVEVAATTAAGSGTPAATA